MDLKAGHINLRIDRLVLRGVEKADGPAIRAAIQRELGRLLGERGLPSSWTPGAPLRLQAAPMRLEQGARPQAIGAGVARSLYGGRSND